MTNKHKAMVAAFGTILTWATAFPFTRYVLQTIGPVDMSVMRIFIAAIVLLIVGLVKGLQRPKTKQDWLLLLVAGCCGNSVYQVFFTQGLVSITAATSAVIVALTPLTTALLLRVFYKEHMSTSGWIYTTTAFIGVAIVLFWGGMVEVSIGALWTMVAVVLFAFYNILSRQFTAKGYTSISIVTWGMVLGAVTGIPFMGHSIRAFSQASIETLLTLGSLGVFSSAIGYAFWSYALEKAEKASDVLNFMYLSPVLAIILAIFLLGEVPSTGLYIGGPIILISLYLFNTYR